MNALLSFWNGRAAPPLGGPRLGPALATVLLTALVYALACSLGSQLGRLPNTGDFASFWPAAAIGLVAVLWRGLPALPGLVLGRLLFDALPDTLAGSLALGPGLASAAQAGLAALQAGLGAGAIRRWVRGPLSLVEPGPTLRWLALAGASALLSGSLNLGFHTPPSWSLAWAWLWLTAVTGDLLGVLLLAPVLWLSLPGQRAPGRRATWLWLLTSLGCLLSGLACAWVIALEHQQVARRWEALQQRQQQALKNELQRHEQVLDSLASVLSQTRQIDRHSFAQSAQPLLGLAEGLSALAWTPVVPQAQRSAFEAGLGRQLGHPQPITERQGDHTVPARARARHLPVQAIEPWAPHHRLLGLDVASEPLRAAAVDAALSQGRPAATPGLTRAPENRDPGLSVQLFRPVAGQAERGGAAPPHGPPRGLVSALVQIDWLAARQLEVGDAALPVAQAPGRLEPPSDILPDTVAYQWLDLDAPAAAQTLWSHQWPATTTPTQAPPEPRWWLGQRSLPAPQRSEWQFAGRHYQLTSQALPHFWSGNTSLWPYLVFTAGLWMTVAASLILLLFTGYQQSLAHEVEDRTVDLLQVQYSLQDAMGHVAAKSGQLEFLLQQTPVGFLGFDEGGTYLLGNQAMVRMLGIRSLAEIPNINVFISLLVQRLPGISLHRLFALGQSQPTDPDPPLQLNRVRLVTLNGQTKHITLQAMKYGVGPVRHLFTVVDLSSDVALESSKSEFLSLMAHEIRTPLTSVMGYAELLRTRPDQPEPMRRELATLITAQARQIQTLLSKMLNLAELEVGGADALKPRLQDLSQWLPGALQRSPVPSGRTPPQWTGTDEALHAMIDPRKLERALHELLGNAYAFSGPEQAVLVRLQRSRSADHGPAVTLSVIDEGLGMDEQQRAQACDKFYRVDKSGEKPGCGLGLPLVKLIAELHHGQLSLTPNPAGTGLIAAITLPLSGPM
ncbi:CHASE domain-containing protein [Curvibacter sp. HBC61]|uniref:histidine kinase n=1 Tax=Curvibacter cyanobacteriorum TaxID=3026422 RepID=A0ABT5N2A8_9BURK|nr:CHASE domain-containing protein [Curvibacter sp. HBC61]MDD0839801.1 CHASE domain-containing protein [Curvibacter sp. HBC61]